MVDTVQQLTAQCALEERCVMVSTPGVLSEVHLSTDLVRSLTPHSRLVAC